MASLSTALLLISVLAGSVAGAFCHAFSSGPVANNTFIRTANSTLVIPQASFPRNNLLSLWTGMGTSNGDLIQALVESYPGTTADYGCGALKKKALCAWASTLDAKGQVGGHQVQVYPGDKVKQSYVYNATDKKYHQAVYVNGKMVSKFATSSGFAQGWGTAEECQPGTPCGYVPAHDWVDTVLVLETADPTYNQTFGNNGSNGTLVTTDGGKTWSGKRLHIQACNFTTSD